MLIANASPAVTRRGAPLVLLALVTAIAPAALPMLAVGAGARVYIRFASGSQTEYLQREFLAIGRGLAWIPIRDGLACGALGAIVLGIGGACALWADRTEASRSPVDASRGANADT